MKDLYKRSHLAPLESDLVKINNSQSQLPEDSEATFAILLNSNRKKEYDKAFKVINTIGQLRAHFDLNNHNNWRQTYSDFVYDKIIEPEPDLDQEEQVEIPKSTPKKKLPSVVMFGGIMALVLLAIGFFVESPEDKNRAVDNSELEFVLMHAVADQVPIFLEADEESAQLGTLNQFEDINIFPEGEDGSWSLVQFQDQEAYAQTSLLGEGSGELAYVDYCKQLGTVNLNHGSSLLVTDSGTHTMIVMNPPGDDAVIKLKGSNSQEALVYYVKGGESLTLNNVPNGNFRFIYATGREYSLQCGRFLENMQAWRANRNFNFIHELHAGKEYNKTISYTLKSPLGSDTAIPSRNF